MATLPAAAYSFTQRFGGFSDLSLKSVRFSPDGSSDSYEACATDIDSLPVSTAGSNQVSLNSNGFLKITPGFSIEYYGVRYDELYIGANGYVNLSHSPRYAKLRADPRGKALLESTERP